MAIDRFFVGEDDDEVKELQAVRNLFISYLYISHSHSNLGYV